ncbi:MAG: glycosyltransferase family 1 protein [Nocardioides sp.]
MSAPTTNRVECGAGTGDLTVASVPASHVYVRHLASEPTGAVIRLPDPDPVDPGRSTVETWWPPVMLQPDWIRAHSFDVFHLQFGFDAWAPFDLERVVGSLRDEGRPLVYTVHDLRNPHHLDRALHDEQLDVLVPAADALVTLTEGAATEIRRRWGRDAMVLPHPHVVDFATMARLRRRNEEVDARTEFRVGLHVKSLRAGMEPLRLLPDLVRAVGELPGGVLQVNGHRDVLDSSGRRYDARLATALRRAEERGDLELHVHDFLTDAALWTYLARLDVSVLPYRFGTHSGWLEACRDLGTTVVAPSCGYFADQAPVLTYLHDEDRYDGDSLVAAVLQSPQRPALGATGIAERRGQRDLLAAAHEDLYRSLLR